MSIVWLSSYPKSGNTWVRTLLTAYFNDGKIDINKMHGTPMGAAKAMLERQLEVSTAGMAEPELEALRPQAYRALSKRWEARGRPALTKVHDIFKQTARGEPLFPPEITKGCIYIVRNPLDVAVSMAHHLGIPMQKSANFVCNELFELRSVGANRSDETQVRQLLGSWQSHVLSWLDQKLMPVHLVKYEDLHSSPETTFAGLLKAIDCPINAERMKRAIHACRFPALQAQELVQRFQEKSKKADSPFFRKGIIGEHRTALNPMQIARVIEKNGTVMRRLGYL